MGSNHNKAKINKYGQFFTNKLLAKKVLEVVNKINKINGVILEPSFGDGVFIDELIKYNNILIDAYEVDNVIYNSYINSDKNINLILGDFILNNINKKYNHIIGNPPYVELNYSFYDDNEIQLKLKEKHKNISDGRINLVHLFIYKSHELLEDNGTISFLLPSTILTSPYYKSLRKFIHDNYNIELLYNKVKFDTVSIDISLLVIRKTNIISDNYIVNYNENYFFTDDYKSFNKSIISLEDSGFNVSIGNLVWNQHKDELTNNSNDYPIIYPKNIINNGIDLSIKLSNNNEKKQYINNGNIKYENFIIIPRTFNIKNKSKIVLVENNMNYITENHTLIITNDNIDKLRHLYKSLIDGKLDKALELFSTTSSLSAKELLTIPFL